MKNMANAYADDIHNNFQMLYANWLPGNPLQLGDYGLMQGGLLNRMGNIAEKEIAFTPRADAKSVDQEYYSADSVEVKFNAKGSGTISGGPTIKASLDIIFSSQNSVFFYAAGCLVKSIEDKNTVGDQILKLVEQDQWNTEFVVVTDIVASDKTTVVISGSEQGGITLEASSAVIPNISLGDITTSLAVKWEKNIGFKAVTAEGMQPLFGLCKVQPTFLWWGREWKPYNAMMLASASVTSKPAKGKGAKTRLPIYFGQLK
jgi:hypothetical protein